MMTCFSIPTHLELINLTSNIALISHFSVFDIFNYLTTLKRVQQFNFLWYQQDGGIHNGQTWLYSGDSFMSTARPQATMSWSVRSGDDTLRWRHNDHDGVSNHQHHGCLLNHLFRCRSKKTSKLRVTAVCAGNSPGTGEFPAQMASYAENVSIWWRHHAHDGDPITKLYCEQFFTVSLSSIIGQYWSSASAIMCQNQICTLPMLTIQLWQITACLQGWV